MRKKGPSPMDIINLRLQGEGGSKKKKKVHKLTFGFASEM